MNDFTEIISIGTLTPFIFITFFEVMKRLNKFTDWFKHKPSRIIIILLWGLMIAFIVYLIVKETTLLNNNHLIELELTGKTNIPAYLTFFVTAISAVYLYTTLTEQRRANQIAEFESRFFKFIDYHRENVNQMEYRNPEVSDKQYFKGNQVFTIIYYEIKDLLDKFFEENPLKNNPNEQSSKDRILKQSKVINNIYQCVFFGAGIHTEKMLRNNIKDDDFFKNIHFFERSAVYTDNKRTHKYYSGHQRRLSHYFRNIFQAIRYVEQQDFLNYKKKYEYVSILRSQMSTYEQAVFFYNSISELGEIWEYKKYSSTNLDNSNKGEIFNKLLITKYDFVRNTLNSDGIISKDINIKDYYPLINLERKLEICNFGVLTFKGEGKVKICRACFNERYIDKSTPSTNREIDDYAIDFKKASEIICDEKNCISKAFLTESGYK